MKKRILFLSLVFSFFFFPSADVRASHLLGGEITWECQSSGKLVFTMKLYRACYIGATSIGGTASIANPLYAQHGGLATINCSRIVQQTLGQGCYNPALQTPCGLSILNGGFRAIEENVYVSSPVQINGVPSVSGSEFYWTSCCRPSNILNVTGSSYFLSAKMFPYKPASSSNYLTLGSTASGPTCYDSSPEFMEEPVSVACMGYTTNFSVLASDQDIDSLTYHWAWPRQSASNNISWKSGFSLKNQFPTSFHNTSNIPATLDTTNGNVSFRAYSPSNGYNVYSIKVTSYKEGQKVSEISRDLPMFFDSLCSPIPVNSNRPVIDMKPAAASTYRTTFDTVIEAGALLELDLRAQDWDILTISPLQFQSIELGVTGEAMSSVANSTNNCGKTPCAYLDSVGNKSYWDSIGKFADTGYVNVRFKWQTSCTSALQSGILGSGPFMRTYSFHVKAKDNSCPSPKSSTFTFKVTVYDSTSTPWQIKEVDASAGGAQLKWDPYTGQNFTAYHLYRKDFYKSGPWKYLTSINNINTTGFHDQLARTEDSVYHYRLQVNDTSECITGVESFNRHLRASIFSQVIELKWLPVDRPGSSGTHKVFQKVNSGNWNQIGSTLFGIEEYSDFGWLGYFNEYKVESTDNNGTLTISNLLEVERDTPWLSTPEIHKPLVEFIPNPFSNELTLLDENEGLLGQTLIIYNMLGEQVREYKVLAPRMSLDMSGLKPGVYFVRYMDNRGNRGTKRLVKME